LFTAMLAMWLVLAHFHVAMSIVENTCGGQACLLQTHYDKETAIDLAAVGEEVVELQSPSVPVAPGIPKTTTATGTLALYDTIIHEVDQLIHSLPDRCDHLECPRGEFAACLLRFTGHDFMDFSGAPEELGGSDGCVDFKDPDNKGLKECLATGENDVRLASIWELHRHEVSFADFIVIAGEGAMIAERGDLQPPLDLRSQFRYGRTTTLNCENQIHLPVVDEGCAEVERTFMQQLGLSARGAAAMMGVHTLGRARVEHSGFDGWWSGPQQSQRFNNNYYLSMLMKGWAPAQTSAGNWQWGRVGNSSGIGETNHEMMLNTDICLAFGDAADRAKELAESNQACCAWIMPDAFDNNGAVEAVRRLHEQTGRENEWCGFSIGRNARRINRFRFRTVKNWCCEPEEGMGIHGPEADCGDPSNLTGIAAADVLEFAKDPHAWIAEFLSAWKHATEVGRVDQLFTPE